MRPKRRTPSTIDFTAPASATSAMKTFVSSFSRICSATRSAFSETRACSPQPKRFRSQVEGDGAADVLPASMTRLLLRVLSPGSWNSSLSAKTAQFAAVIT